MILESEGYQGRTGAVNGMDSVRRNGRDVGRYEILQEGGVRFILKATNGQEIAQSASSFSSVAEAEAAVQSTASLLDSERVGNPW